MSPERGETSSCLLYAPSGLKVGRTSGSQAMPWADLSGPFGARSQYPVSLL